MDTTVKVNPFNKKKKKNISSSLLIHSDFFLSTRQLKINFANFNELFTKLIDLQQ